MNLLIKLCKIISKARMGYLNANYKAHLPTMNKIHLSCVLWFMLLHNLPQSLVLSRYPESEDQLHLGVARLAFELTFELFRGTFSI